VCQGDGGARGPRLALRREKKQKQGGKRESRPAKRCTRRRKDKATLEARPSRSSEGREKGANGQNPTETGNRRAPLEKIKRRSGTKKMSAIEKGRKGKLYESKGLKEDLLTVRT